MTALHPSTLAAFVRALAVLSWSADAQLGWLESLGLPGGVTIADELG